MSSIALRPRSVTELVDASIQVYKREAVAFLLAVALLYVPWLVVRLAFGLSEMDVSTRTSIAATIVSILFSFVYIFAGGVTTVLASDVYLGKPADIRAAFRRIGGCFGSLLSVSIAVGLLTGLGALLLLIPAFYVIARFCVVQQAVVLEGKDAGDGFSRSSVLTEGLKWHALKTLALMFVILIAINIGAGLLLGLIPSTVVQETGSAVVSIIVVPTFGIVQTLLYYDLRIRKEGFDVEYLASQAGSASPSVGSSPAAL